MWRILQHHEARDWVLATGEATSVRKFVEITFEKLGRIISWHSTGITEKGIDQNGNILVEIDSRYYRPTEVPHLLGDASQAKTLLGWKTTYTIELLISEMIQAVQL